MIYIFSCSSRASILPFLVAFWLFGYFVQLLLDGILVASQWAVVSKCMLLLLVAYKMLPAILPAAPAMMRLATMMSEGILHSHNG